VTVGLRQSGFIVAAPASGSGKTVLTLALLRAFRNRGLAVGSFKVGPDYIDPGFHAAASGATCVNIDPWAMQDTTMAACLQTASSGADIVIGEGVMGLFDGAANGVGSTADLAERLGLPIVLVVDAGGQSTSAAAIVHGFDSFRASTRLSAVIFNRVGSQSHAAMLMAAMEAQPVPVLGCMPRAAPLSLPERHLGLVLAEEHQALEPYLEAAAAAVADHVDLDALLKLDFEAPCPANGSMTAIPPLGQRIAVARDEAFAFAYPHVLDGWRAAGAEITLFSPLANMAPPLADAIYLPGGYPELHAGQLSANRSFMSGLRAAAENGTSIYGECGGYMVLGRSLVDADGTAHAMADLLPLETSFAERRLHLGYRDAVLAADMACGRQGDRFRGHEFHYATILREDGDDIVFTCADARNRNLGGVGRRIGRVAGSFLHLIDRN
jgi:cobyrinic acid a,c-diamide synthase